MTTCSASARSPSVHLGYVRLPIGIGRDRSRLVEFDPCVPGEVRPRPDAGPHDLDGDALVVRHDGLNPVVAGEFPRLGAEVDGDMLLAEMVQDRLAGRLAKLLQDTVTALEGMDLEPVSSAPAIPTPMYPPPTIPTGPLHVSRNWQVGPRSGC